MNEESVIQEQKEVKKIVEEILQADRRARNDDLWLILQYWQKKQQIKLFIPYEEFYRMTKAESITRCRRSIQNTDGKLLPTDPQILIKRRVKEDIIRRFYANDPNTIREWNDLRYGVKR